MRFLSWCEVVLQLKLNLETVYLGQAVLSVSLHHVLHLQYEKCPDRNNSFIMQSEDISIGISRKNIVICCIKDPYSEHLNTILILRATSVKKLIIITSLWQSPSKTQEAQSPGASFPILVLHFAFSSCTSQEFKCISHLLACLPVIGNRGER